MKTKFFVLIASAFLLAAPSSADEAIRLYEGKAVGSEDWTHSEKEYYSSIFQTEVVTNVVHPSVTPFLPDENLSGTAVIIAPGGGFHSLSINREGNDVAKWLNEKGIAAFVLRYRLLPTGKDGVQEMIMKAGNRPRLEADMASVAPLAGADGLRAVAYVRDHAEQYKLSPDRIGFMGFSAGGAVTAYVAFNANVSSRPNFIAPIYAGLGAMQDWKVPNNAPPLFLVAATNDPLGLATDSLTLYRKWREAGKSAELHMYAKGGHGFGMKQQNLPSDKWIERFHEWLNSKGVLED